MSARLRTIVIVGLELCLVVAMAASFVYFVLESRNFLALGGSHGPHVTASKQASGSAPSAD